MLKAFNDALDAGQIEPSALPGGQPFVIDGVQYYQAANNGIDMLMGRFHAFSDTLRRHDVLKLDDELVTTAFATLVVLLKRIRAQANLDSEQVLDAAQEGLTILDRLEQRRAMGLDISQVYEIASIWHFADDEDPAIVDSDRMKRNARRFATAPNAAELYAFFLRSPIGKFVPLHRLLDENTLNYIQQVQELELLDWTRTQLMLKTDGANSATISTIQSRKETLYALHGLTGQLLNSTMISVPPGSAVNSEKPEP